MVCCSACGGGGTVHEQEYSAVRPAGLDGEAREGARTPAINSRTRVRVAFFGLVFFFFFICNVVLRSAR